MTDQGGAGGTRGPGRAGGLMGHGGEDGTVGHGGAVVSMGWSLGLRGWRHRQKII